MPSIKPKRLKAGDTLSVVTPASPISKESLEKGLKHFTDAGFKVKVSPNVLVAEDYLAGPDELRATELMAAFEDPETDAVLCTRGGYGCARIMSLIDLDRIIASKKQLIGFSDITTLHVALNNRGFATIHAPMALTLSYDRVPHVYDSIFGLMQGSAEFPSEAEPGTTVVGGVAEGELVGGCMILICDTLGTPYEIDTKGKILVLEDVDEVPHRVDAMMTHLLNSGKLQQSAGVLVGEMTRSDEKFDAGIGARPWREIVSERLIRAGVPSIIDFPFGHHPKMLSLALGVRARMDADAGTLEYLEAPCD